MKRQPEPELMDLPEEAEAYAAADFAEVNTAFVTRLLELAGGRETARAIDLGAGPADITLLVADARPGWRLTAVDAAPAMIDLARAGVEAAGLQHRVELLLADATATALPAAGFDVLYSNSILHHVASPPRLWAEIRRLARPGAWLLLRDLFRPDSEAEARRLVDLHAGDESSLLREEFYRSLLSAYTPGEVEAQLAAAGLTGLEVCVVSDRHLDVLGQIETA